MKVVMWAPGMWRPLFETVIGAIAGVELVSVGDNAEFAAAVPGARVAMLPIFFYEGAAADAVRAEAPRLGLVQLLTAGLDKFATEPPPRGVTIATAGAGMSPAVAEHAVSLLLALGRRVVDAHAFQAGAEWDSGRLVNSMRVLADQRVLVFGFGNIGREAAVRLRAFGARVIGMSRSAPPEPLADEMHPTAALDEVLPGIDSVIVAAPLTDETHHVFDQARLARMKRGAFIVNIARGGIIDNLALAEALRSGQIGGAGLDVTEPEPLPAGHLLWHAPNVIITPHVAGAGGQRRLAAFIAENITSFRDGAPLRAVVRV